MIRFNLGVVLAERKRNGDRITYADIANAIGVHENTIYNIVNNRVSSVNLDVLDLLCDALEVTPSDILEYTPNDPPRARIGDEAISGS